MNTRCKFTVESVKYYSYAEEVTMNAVYGGSAENNSFAEATPTGKLVFTVTNKAVIGHIKPGQYYYVDLTLAEA